MDIKAKIIEQAIPSLPPVGYLTFFNDLTDPMKVMGFIVLLLQAVYIGIKIYKEWKGEKKIAQVPENT